MITGKQINSAIKSFLKNDGVTSEDSGVFPDPIVEGVQNIIDGDRETRADVGLAVVVLLTSYAEMALSGSSGSVDYKAGLYWLNPRGGADAQTQFPIGMPRGVGVRARGVPETAAGRSGKARSSARSRRMESARAEIEEPVLEGLDLGLESSTQGEPLPTVAMDDSHSTSCSQLVKSVVALHNAQVIGDDEFKRLIVRISEVCD